MLAIYLVDIPHLARASSRTFPGVLAGWLRLGMAGVAWRGVRGVRGVEGTACLIKELHHKQKSVIIRILDLRFEHECPQSYRHGCPTFLLGVLRGVLVEGRVLSAACDVRDPVSLRFLRDTTRSSSLSTLASTSSSLLLWRSILDGTKASSSPSSSSKLMASQTSLTKHSKSNQHIQQWLTDVLNLP